MKVFFRLLALCSLFLLNLHGLNIKKGWNYIGVSSSTSIEQIKKRYPKINKIFIISNDKYEDITNKDELIIKPNEGILIEAMGDFSIYFNSKVNSLSKISFKKGWNFKALSVNTSILAKTFKDKDIKMWIYKPSQKKWFLYDANTNKNANITLRSMQGFLIYSPISKTYDLKRLSIELKPFSDKSSMYNFLEQYVTFHKRFNSSYVYDTQPMPLATTAANKSSVSDATSTNTQEIDIDEADVIKHNNKNIFYIANNALYVDSFENVLLDKKQSIKIDTFKNHKNINIRSLYLDDDKLIVLASEGYRMYRNILPNVNFQNTTYIQIYDVADINDIHLLRDIKMDGSLVNTRFYNGKLYLVSRYTPYFKVKYQEKLVDCYPIEPIAVDKVINERILPVDKPAVPSLKCRDIDREHYKIISKHIHPTIDIDNHKSDLLNPEKFFASTNMNEFFDIITTVSFDLDSLDIADTISVLGHANMLYMSKQALYLASSYYGLGFRGDFSNIKTLIYKLSLKNNLSYAGNIFVNGRVLNQFSFSEYKDILRIATTSGQSFRNNTNNMISAIKETDGKLEQIGYLDNLGKAGESIRSVRFMKDKAFLVTFKRTDPFYTIDLSDARDIKKAGELHMPGFSTYLHDIGNGQILALGNDADKDGRAKGIQIQLFDVQDFKHPSVLDRYIFKQGYYSNALYQHKAFTYRVSDNTFAIQINSYKPKFYGFYVFRIENKEIKQISIVENDYAYGGRSIIFTKDNKNYILMLDTTLSAKEIK